MRICYVIPSSPYLHVTQALRTTFRSLQLRSCIELLKADINPLGSPDLQAGGLLVVGVAAAAAVAVPTGVAPPGAQLTAAALLSGFHRAGNGSPV